MKETLRKKAAICACAAELAFQGVFTSYGAWHMNEGGQWQYTPPNARDAVKASWYQVDGQWYWFDQNGFMKTGWHTDPDGQQYFLNPVSDGTKGRLMTGWQWIDGRCYYFSEYTDQKHSQGAMYAGEKTCDGYWVNQNGAWARENGSPVYKPGKGILTAAGFYSGKSKERGLRKSQSPESEDGTEAGPDGSQHGDDAADQEFGAGESQDDNGNPDSRGAPLSESRPEDGRKSQVQWKLYFTDSTTHQSQLAPSKSGTIEDGANLTIYFQTKIIDSENRIWKSLQKSPYVITVTGPQDRMIYVEYEEAGKAAQEEDPWEEERERLRALLERAKKQEALFSGIEEAFLDSRFLAADKNSCDKRLKSAAARIAPGERGTFYVIGKNYIPEGSVLTAVYGDDMEYSNTVEDKVTLEQDVYLLSRFQLFRKEKNHRQERIWSPGEKQHWNIGDVQQRELDGKLYRFRCIDQNYGDETDWDRQKALFLCESVIPADIGSSYTYEKQEDGTYGYTFYPGPVTDFGDSDSYKYSNIRKWLKQGEKDFEDAQEVSTGVSYGYEGSTRAGGGMASAASGQGLKSSYIGSQAMTDRLFILSVDEAVKYSSWLWIFNGAKEENPESQQSTFCKSYWLRNPWAGNGEDKVYVVDLIEKNIRPQEVRKQNNTGDLELDITGTAGVRPAFAVAQR